MVPQTVAKIAICDYPMASSDCLITLIAKLVKVGGVYIASSRVGNDNLVKGMLLVKLDYTGTRLNSCLLNTHYSNAVNITTCLHSCLHL